MRIEMKERQTNKKFWQILMILAAVLCLVCLIALASGLWTEHEKEKQHESFVEEYTETTPNATEASGENVDTESAKTALKVDFASLQAENPDVFAWISIPGTDIDYPLLQYAGEDQSYYLNRNMYKEKDRDGSIYIEIYNANDFSDPNTLIYGHNWSTGGMFHSLEKFQKQEFFDEHPTMYIYFPDRILTYEIFASYEYDDRHLLYSFDFHDADVYADYLKTILQPRDMNARIRDGVTLTTDDRIITLSTCVIGKKESRQLVQAVLVGEEEAEYRGETTDAE